MASNPITLWQINGETVETVAHLQNRTVIIQKINEILSTANDNDIQKFYRILKTLTK